VDETRTLDNYSGASSVQQAVLEYLPFATLDPWQGKLILVLTESRSLAGVLRTLADEYRVRIASTNGQCGGFLHTRLAPMLLQNDIGEMPQVLYLGDFDLAGNQIEENTRRVLEQRAGTLAWRRVALTAQQVEDHSLPVIMKHESSVPRRSATRSGRDRSPVAAPDCRITRK
jgi:hypothetical protein